MLHKYRFFLNPLHFGHQRDKQIILLNCLNKKNNSQMEKRHFLELFRKRKYKHLHLNFDLNILEAFPD